jgi:hypothetical protein
MDDIYFNDGTQDANHDIFRYSHIEVQASTQQNQRDVMEIFEDDSECIRPDNNDNIIDNNSSSKNSDEYQNGMDAYYLPENQNSYNYTNEYYSFQEGQSSSLNCCFCCAII